jgi:acetoin utilization protein AcuC
MRTTVVWDEALLAYKLSSDHPLHPVRLDLTMRLARSLGVLEGIEPLVPTPAPDAELERVHVASYLDAVRRAPQHGDDPVHQLGTMDNPIFEGMHDAAALISGGSIAAAREIAQGRADRAVNLSGGLHHAMRDHAWGFCIYNDCAIAISWLLDHGYTRIAYLDTDVHHGDGVQAAFLDDPRVMTISMHQHPRTLWPGTGFASELGDGPAAGTAVNLPLPPGTRDPAWLRAFHAVVPSLLRAFEPQILVTQCGADTHHEDPLAELSLTVDGHRAIYQACRGLAEEYAGGKWLALGGGGYNLFRGVPRSWTHLLATVLDRDVDPQRPIPASWTSYATGLSNRPLPTSMTEDAPTTWEPWGGYTEIDVDRFVLETRRAVFPLHGLEPQNVLD